MAPISRCRQSGHMLWVTGIDCETYLCRSTQLPFSVFTLRHQLH
ncbi:MAG: hypothetical protein RLZZ562_2963, partial [Planctomycetota bacterium]